MHRVSATLNLEGTWKLFYYLSDNIQPITKLDRSKTLDLKNSTKTINAQDFSDKVSYTILNKVIQVDSNGNNKDITTIPLQAYFEAIPEGINQPLINSTLGFKFTANTTLQQYSTLPSSNSKYTLKLNYNIPVTDNIGINVVLKDDSYTTMPDEASIAEEKKYVSLDFTI